MSNQEKVAKDAIKSFLSHELTCESKTDKVALYRCAQPGTSCFSFRVVVAPGCIVVYGDIGDGMIYNYKSFQDQIPWLRGSVNSSRYLIDKMVFAEREFCEETAKANWENEKENYEEGDEEFEDIVSDNYPDQAWYNFFYGSLRCDESPGCEDYKIGVYWTVECLKKFIELLDKENSNG